MNQGLLHRYATSTVGRLSASAYYRLSCLGSRHAAEPYASHVPVLVGLSLLLRPKRVLELGSGDFSTALFLERALFPDLEELHSFENDQAWYERMRSRLGDDPRLRLTLHSGPMAGAVTGLKAVDFDLVFVDDSVEPRIRMDTLVEVCRKLPARDTAVVVHDFEHLWHRLGCASAKNCFTFVSMRPQTAVVWNQGGPSRERLRALAEIIRENRDKFRAGDANAWSALYCRELKNCGKPTAAA